MTVTDTKISVRRVIDAPTKDIFDLLTLPQRHQEFDGSGMVRADEKSQRIQSVGDEFTMNMHNDDDGDYQMTNLVHVYTDNKQVGWQPQRAGQDGPPAGWEYVYELESLDSGSTEVTLNYDWSKVTDAKLLQNFPRVSEQELEGSLNLLAATVTG